MQFRDLPKQYEVLKPQIDAAMVKVAASAHYISGPEVKELENALAEYVGVKHCITCANGTDAISIAMRAWGVGKGDAVFVPDFTFFSSGECPADEGATPIYVDVDQNTYNIDPIKLEEAVQKVKDGEMTGTVLNDHIGQSHAAVDVAVKLLNGEAIENYYWVDYVMVNKAYVEAM